MSKKRTLWSKKHIQMNDQNKDHLYPKNILEWMTKRITTLIKNMLK